MEKIGLTHFSSFGGCGAKLPSEYLKVILESLKGETGEHVTGIESLDDAALYKITDDLSLLHTIDFFTPIVDDPYTFGQIAATNAINDIYAMGGEPIMALNLVEFPVECLGVDVLNEILRGGKDKIVEAGAIIGGGHTLRGSDLKYGLAVLGKVEPRNVCRNSTAKPGDKLILTKPLGVGIITTAIKKGLKDKNAIKKACEVMTMLNDKPAKLMKEVSANACTDITGFGLVGHALEMAKGSKLGINININSVPYLEEAAKLAEEGIASSAMCTNRKCFTEEVIQNSKFSETLLDILYDPQTAGGLLISLPGEKSDLLIQKLKENGVPAEIIGEVVKERVGKVVLG